MGQKGKNNWVGYAIAILIFILLCFLIIPSLFIQKSKEINEKRQNLAVLKEKLKNLEKIINDTHQRKASLDSKFENQYLWARGIIAIVWLFIQFIYFYHFGYLGGITNALEFNGYCLTVMIAANFVLYGKFTDIKEMIERFEMWLRNRVYRNDKTIHEDLLAYDNEKNEVVSKIDQLKQEIENLESQSS